MRPSLRLIARVCLTAFCTLLIPTAVTAQATRAVPPKSPGDSAVSDTTRYPILRVGRHQLPLMAVYDSAHDKTVLRLERVALDSSLAISALVAMDGAPVRTPAKGVVLTFWSTAPSKRFEQRREIRIAGGSGQAIDLGPGWPVPKPAAGFTEVLMRSVPLATFLEIATATKAELVIGDVKVSLPSELLAALEEFAARMAPGAPQRWGGQ